MWTQDEPLESLYSKRTSWSPEPCRIRRCAFPGSFFHGIFSEKSNFFASARSVPPVQVPEASPMLAIAPPSMLFEGSGITRAGSTRSNVPSPSQAGHAPYGELNEKVRGCGSSTLVPQLGQAAPWEKIRSSFSPSRAIATRLLPSLSADSSESASRVRFLASTVSRSTTTSMSWRL